MSLRTVDLFSGCGGLSLGFHLAGFETALAVDVDPDLSSSYQLNFPKAKHLVESLHEFDCSRWAYLLGKEKIAGVIGGPPCQGFSLIGKRRTDDPRNLLIGKFFEHVRAISPMFFVMENVPGLLIGEPRSVLDAALETVSDRYNIVGPVSVRSGEFGAATDRERIVVIGYDSRYVNTITESDIAPPKGINQLTVADAIGNLPEPVVEAMCERRFDWKQISEATEDRNAALPWLVNPFGKNTGWDFSINKWKEGVVSGFTPTVHTKSVSERYGSVRPGSVDDVSKSPRLKWEGRCPTIRAGTGKDKGAHQCPRPIHPSQPRVITVREAARLQGFPDWFVFHPTKWHSFRMIGNSVSPPVATCIARMVRSKLEPLAKAA